jgi:internalin A
MTRDELLALIDQAAREGWTELDLSGQEITELPPEVGLLTNLQQLDLSFNQLTTVVPGISQLVGLQTLNFRDNLLAALPLEITRLTRLQTLDFTSNSLTTLPPEIGLLTNLQSLKVSLNQLLSLPPEIGQLGNLQIIDLSINQLGTIPAGIGRLTDLQTLDISRNELTILPIEIGHLASLQAFDLHSNWLTAVPSEIGHLTHLTSLNLSENQLRALPPEISQLINLTSLNLSHNRLTTVPPEIGQLSNLQHLRLHSNKLTAIPPQFGQLCNLQELYLNSNRLTDIPTEISALTNLRLLHLSSNQLTTLPPPIVQLINLQSLHVSSNRLTTFPLPISQLTRLQSLHLSSNQFTAVPPEIARLIHLEKLYLNGNKITSLPSEIGQLHTLQELFVGANKLTHLPPEIGQLVKLRLLHLHSNQIATLPSTLRQLTQLTDLRLYYNPLPISPELMGNRRHPDNYPHAIFDAYFQASRPLREAKLLLVGEGSVGKTSLVERLLHNRPPSDKGKTVGVDIHRWEVSSEKLAVKSEKLVEVNASESDQRLLRVNVWDFGGQEIYHATHQFFLTHRSLYLVVIEARKDETANRLAYWLRHVQSFAGDAPIILVVNKSDQGRLALDERSLMLQYPTIRAIIHTSCTTGAGIFELRHAIEEALAALPHVNDWIPVTWFAVKEKLSALGKDFLPYESYVDLCEAEGITHEAAQQTLARFLHDLGAALNFHDDRRLSGTHVLNPEWVTGGIYAILNAPALQEWGILNLNKLDAILDRRRYPPHKHAFLLDIMGKFELAAPLAGGQRYLIPGLLPKGRPAFEWPADAPTALEYRYVILPTAILSRLMVRLHHHTWQPERGQPVRWRNGLGVARDGCRALIVADPEAARLIIALDGPAPHRRHLLAAIRAQLDEIHASFAKLEAEEFVPIPGHPAEKAIAYEDLLYYESEQDWEPRYAPIKARIDVRALLDGIESPEERDMRPLVSRLIQQFNRAELRQLAFDLQLDHENLPGETKSDLVRELALACRRHGRLAELERVVEKERP